jgi:hypothetical protein
MNRLVATCFATVGLAGLLLAVQPPVDEATALRDHVLKATTPEAKAKAYKAWFTAVGRAGLPALTKDADTGIALQAAWEVNKKPARRSRRAEDVGDDHYDPAEAKKFVAVVAERTKVKVPTWWADTVTEPGLRPGKYHSFDVELDRRWLKDRDGPWAEVRGESVLFVDGDRSIKFPTTALYQRSPRDRYAGVVTADWAVVTSYSTGGGGSYYRVAGFGPRGGEPIWKGLVWGSGRTLLIGYSPHRVEAVEREGIVYLFGAESHGAYVEAFEGATGRCRFRFCSCYWFDSSEAWDLK